MESAPLPKVTGTFPRVGSGLNRVRAIKSYREQHPGVDLKAATEAVDAMGPQADGDGQVRRRQVHKLGFGVGTIVEHPDGSASFRKPATLTDAFRVRISDVTGFSVSKGGKILERRLKVLGRGTDLASADVNHGAAEKIEAWFRAHPAFGQAPAGPAARDASPPSSVADELTKLAGLRNQGVLTDEEFAAQKARLLS